MMGAKVREDRKIGTLFRRSMWVIVLVVLLSFLVSLLHPLRTVSSMAPLGLSKAAAIGWSMDGTTIRYRCDRASDDTREAINYYVDPCEDFHAFACSAARDSGQRQRGDARTMLQHALTELSTSERSQDAAVKAAVVFTSCLAMPLSLVSAVRRNMIDFSKVTNITKETLLRTVKTPRDVFNLSAFLSYNSGIKPFLSFESGPGRNSTIRLSRPFSSFLKLNTVEEIFMAVSELFYGDERLKAIKNLLAADVELRKALAELKTTDISINVRVSPTEEGISERDWKTIVSAYIAHNGPWSDEGTRNAGGMKTVFSLLFRQLKDEEAVVYAMAHALLPEPIIRVLQEDDRSEACLRLLANIFGFIWEDLETYVMGFFDENNEAESVATGVVSTLKDMLSSRSRLARSQEAVTAHEKLSNVRFSLPSAKDFISSFGSAVPNLGRLSSTSLYWNIVQWQKSFARNGEAKRYANERRGRSGLAPGTLVLQAESFKPSSFCHGKHNLLNYATLGTKLAATLLRYITEEQDGAPTSSLQSSAGRSIISSLTDNITMCLGRENTGLTSWKLLPQVALQTVAFQVALEASKSRASAFDTRLEAFADAPARQQTFFVKYCQAQCAKAVDRSGTTSQDMQRMCNLVVMNSPLFTQLFRCEHGDKMAPAEYCFAI